MPMSCYLRRIIRLMDFIGWIRVDFKNLLRNSHLLRWLSVRLSVWSWKTHHGCSGQSEGHAARKYLACKFCIGVESCPSVSIDRNLWQEGDGPIDLQPLFQPRNMYCMTILSSSATLVPMSGPSWSWECPSDGRRIPLCRTIFSSWNLQQMAPLV